MKIIVTGSLGNISKPLAQELIQKGHSVTVIGHNPERQKDIEALGAKAAIGPLDDVEFLSAVFTGADAVYCMVPPNFEELNSVEYYKRIGQSYKKAIEQSKVKRIVFSSSWGAHLDKGTGTILGSYHVEQILNDLEKVHITHLRPCSIYYNLYHYIAMIKNADIIGTNFKGSDKIVWAAPKDIADAAAEELTKQTNDKLSIRYVASDEVTADETAKALGKAIGKPDLKWTSFSNEQVKKSFIEMKLPEDFAQDLVDLNASISSGRMGEDYELNKPELGKVKIEDFAKEFAMAYNQK
jgi:uncharacterized protein YbjT (DUF2867 family)